MIIYSKDGLTQRCEVKKFTYNGTFLEQAYITTTITSEAPIQFSVGDYCEYRGERFELNYIPSKEKVSSTNTYGEGYIYEDVKFLFLGAELSNCSFLDYVVGNVLTHYSGLPTFSFYGTVNQLADRIQANLDRVYKNALNGTVSCSSSSGIVTGVGTSFTSLSIGDRIRIGDNYRIILSIESDTQLTVTIPFTNTYSNVSITHLLWNISVDDSFVGADLNITATNITCWDALKFAYSSFGANYTISGRNIIIGATAVNVGSTFGYKNGIKSLRLVPYLDSSVITRLKVYGSTRNIPYRWYNKQINPSTSLPYIPDSMYVSNLMLPSFLENGGDAYIDDAAAIQEYGIKEDSVFFDGSDENLEEIYPSIEGITYAQLVAAGVAITQPVGDNGKLDEIYSAVNPTDDGILPDDGTSLPSTFTITLKDLGFDLSAKVGDNYLYATTSGEMTVSVNSGNCVGYSFSIINIVKHVVSGVITYELTCNRYSDDEIGMAFPNSSYQLLSGDKFVLVNIQMPDVYIFAAMQRLLQDGTSFLDNRKYQKSTYEFDVDNIYMAKNPLTSIKIKEGNVFDFSDTDFNISESVIIKNVEIKEDESLIPQYSVTLSNEYEDTGIGKIRSEISKIKVSVPSETQTTNWDLSSAYAHYHGNKSLIDLINQTNIDVLGHLSVVEGKLQADIDFYSTGEVSAFGAGSGGSSGGGLIQTVYGYSSLGSSFNNATLTDTFNAYTINQLHTRLSQVELGAAVNVAVGGTGNAITGVTKNGNVLEFTKGSTFSLVGHTHDYIPLSQKGTANGIASLDANGLIISAQLPSYVDDVIEVSAYANLPTVGESGKIYVTTDTNITYRWTGTTYVEISKSIALGETSSTAYRGDLGAIAYAHSQIAGGTGVHVSSTERTNWNLAYTNSHTHTNKSVLDGITSTLISNWNIAYTNSHTHANKSLIDAFSQSDNDVLNHLSIVDGKLKVDIDLYSLGEISAFGAGSGTGGSGLIKTVYGLSGLGGNYSDSTLTDTFNAYAINSLHNRINSLEAGSALTFTTTGSGNAVTSMTKSGTSVTVTKGLTFSVDGHTHSYLALSGGTMTGALNFNNGTWNNVGDDVAIGDINVAGQLGLKALNTVNPGIAFYNNSAVAVGNLISNAGTLQWSGNTVWHAGNDGAGSGLDADYLRGYTVSVGNNTPFNTIPVIHPSGWMDIGLQLEFHYDNVTASDYSTILRCTGNYSNIVDLPSSYGTLALLSDNVASATKLQTARTIAGVSFDGSANITIPFANLSSIPTTLSGYGITDAYTKTQTDAFLALKLDVATFSDLFEKVNIGTTASPVYAIKAKYNFYSVGEISAFGAGAGSGGSGLIQTVYGYSGLGGTYNNASLTDTFNAYTINKINSDLGARITSLESGSALTFTTVGSGNAITSVTKAGTSVTVTKGLTFSVDGHTHTFASLTSKPTTLSGYGITDALLKSDINIQVGGTKNSQMLWTSWNNSDAYGGAIQIREYGYVDNTQSDWYYSPAISFHWRNRYAKRFGMRYDGQFAIDNNPILWSGNYSSYALPLSGGTLTGNLTAPNYLRSDGATIWHSGNFTNLNQLTTRNFSDLQNKPTTLSGYGITDALLATSYTAADVLTKIKTVDGSGSGLDADSLDGRGGIGYLKYCSSLETSGLDFDTIDLFGSNDGFCARCESGVLNPPITGVQNWSLWQQGNKYRGSQIALHACSLGTGMYVRSSKGDSDSWNNWRKVAFEDSNVESATKLKTPRTIWGQNFDGSGNVSGDIDLQNFDILGYGGARILQGLGGNIGINPTNNVLIGTTADAGYKLYVNGTLGVNGTSSFKDVQVAYDKKIGIEYSTTDRNMYNYFYGNDLFHLSVGNWTSSTSKKVFSIDTPHSNALGIWNNGYAEFSNAVSGNRFYAGYDSGVANSISCSAWFRSNGETGWYNSTYGGGIYMADSTYVRVYNNKAFWVDNNIVATGEITAFGASDIRLKSNIKQIDSALDFLGKVKTYEFDWNDKALTLNPLKTKRGAGVIAQELQTLDSDFVHSIYGDYLGVDYERFIPYLIKGVNDVSDEVAELKIKVKQLEIKLNKLQNQK